MQGEAVRTRAVLTAAFVALALVALVSPMGERPTLGAVTFDPATGRETFAQEAHGPLSTGLALGQVAGLLLVASLALGYRRLSPGLPRAWRPRAHVRVGLAILVVSVGHAALLLWLGDTRGWASGILALAALAAHGATGALRRPLGARWGATRWAVIHRGTAWGALALTIEHVLLASRHYGFG